MGDEEQDLEDATAEGFMLAVIIIAGVLMGVGLVGIIIREVVDVLHR